MNEKYQGGRSLLLAAEKFEVFWETNQKETVERKGKKKKKRGKIPERSRTQKKKLKGVSRERR